jgi:pimeloyl-ACP methyl ester carboxylesterase
VRYSRQKASTIAITRQHLLLLAFLLASPAVTRATQAAEGTATVPRYEPSPCPKLKGIEWLADASCGYLVVPENRSRPAGRNIRLMVAKYPARSAEKRRDPVIYLAGGPGDIAPLEVNGFIAANFIHDRDIVVMSQRGTMFSEPALTCASIDNFARELLGLRFYSEATKRAHLAATEACHRELAAAGADLSAYNSTESASDFADLRKVLGYDTWNVYGNSYGSYLAQTLMRDHPEGIRSLVLDSVLPTTYTVPRKLVEHARRLRQPLPGLRGGTRLQRCPSSSRRNFHRTGQQARGRAADGSGPRPRDRRRRQGCPRRRGAGRLAA